MTIGGIEEVKFQKLTSPCGAARAATPHFTWRLAMREGDWSEGTPRSPRGVMVRATAAFSAPGP